VHAAARDGRLKAAPLLGLVQHASIVANGIDAILRIERVNTVWDEAPPADQSDPPLSRSTMYSLLELARLSANTLVREIERVTDWTETHGVTESRE
jgi:hypothetical protein